MKKLGKLKLCLPLLFFIIGLSTRATCTEKDEAIFAFKYKNLTTDYTVYLDNDSLYLPFEEVLSFLKIYYQVDDNKNFEGYINVPDSSFSIEFNSGNYKNISGDKRKINSNQWFSTTLQIYIRVDLLADLFKFKLPIYFNQLTVSCNCDYELPVMRGLKVNWMSEHFKKEVNEEHFGPDIGNNKFIFLDGGIMDYSLGFSNYGIKTNLNFNNNIGLALLGGEFQYSISGNYIEKNLNYISNGRLRYIFNSDFITNLSFGDLQGLSARNSGGRSIRKQFNALRGVQITNETMKMPLSFTNYVISDIIEPNWNVELYIENQLFDVKRADLNGYYRFDIPIKYGMTNILVKYYGTKGEFIVEEKVVSVPSELLTSGSFKYTFSAGIDRMSEKKVIDGNMALGLFDWLTSSFSATKVESDKDYTLVSQSSINLFSNTLLNLVLSNQGVYEARLVLPSTFLGNIDLNYVAYDKSSSYNPNRLESSLQFMSSVNLLFNLPISLSIMGSSNLMNNYRQNSLNTNLSLNTPFLNLQLRQNISFLLGENVKNDLVQYYDFSASFNIGEVEGFFDFISRSRINFNWDYVPLTKSVNHINASYELQLSREIFMNFTYNYFFSNKMQGLNLGISMNLQSFRSKFQSEINQQFYSFNGDINGSLEFDSENYELNIMNSMGGSNYGKSSASIRYFIDKNNDNVFSDGDKLLSDVDCSITNEMATKSHKSGGTIFSNLVPGSKYNVKVKLETMPNPTIVPKYTEFSFIAQPFSYKSIDVPCEVGGLMEGSVMKIVEGNKTGQGGLKIHIESQNMNFNKTVNVFSDGSFYFSGLPVGKHTVSIDSTQLAIIKCKAVPASFDIECKPNPDGDIISDLNFDLISLKKEDTLESKSALTKAENYDKSKKDIKPINSDEKSKIISKSQDIKQVNSKEILKNNDSKNNIVTKNDELINNRLIDTTKPLDVNNLIKLRSFTYSSVIDMNLSKELKTYLDDIGSLLVQNSSYSISINSHSDSFGTLEQNMQNSQKRGDAVKNYLLKKGIDEKRILLKANGALYPVASNSTPEGRKQNRRVEIRILK